MLGPELVLLGLAVAAVARASASVLQTWIKQASCTRRLNKSLEGAKPQQRPASSWPAVSLREGLQAEPTKTRLTAIPRLTNITIHQR